MDGEARLGINAGGDLEGLVVIAPNAVLRPEQRHDLNAAIQQHINDVPPLPRDGRVVGDNPHIQPSKPPAVFRSKDIEPGEDLHEDSYLQGTATILVAMKTDCRYTSEPLRRVPGRTQLAPLPVYCGSVLVRPISRRDAISRVLSLSKDRVRLNLPKSAQL